MLHLLRADLGDLGHLGLVEPVSRVGALVLPPNRGLGKVRGSRVPRGHRQRHLLAHRLGGFELEQLAPGLSGGFGVVPVLAPHRGARRPSQDTLSFLLPELVVGVYEEVFLNIL